MRATIQRENSHGGNDFYYRIQCDECGEFLKTIPRKNKPAEIIEFRTCGEETLSAISRGWMVQGNIAICDACMKAIGGQ